LLHDGPRVDLILAIWRADDATVLVVEAAQEIGSFGGAPMVGDIQLKLRQV
jgi:hypothetical protein